MQQTLQAKQSSALYKEEQKYTQTSIDKVGCEIELQSDAVHAYTLYHTAQRTQLSPAASMKYLN